VPFTWRKWSQACEDAGAAIIAAVTEPTKYGLEGGDVDADGKYLPVESLQSTGRDLPILE